MFPRRSLQDGYLARILQDGRLSYKILHNNSIIWLGLFYLAKSKKSARDALDNFKERLLIHGFSDWCFICKTIIQIILQATQQWCSHRVKAFVQIAVELRKAGSVMYAFSPQSRSTTTSKIKEKTYQTVAYQNLEYSNWHYNLDQMVTGVLGTNCQYQP